MIDSLTAALMATAVFSFLLWFTARRERLDAFAFGAVLFNLAWVSLVFWYKFYYPDILKEVSAQITAYTLFLLCVPHLLRAAPFRFARTPLDKPVLAFFALCVLSMILAPMKLWYFAVEEAGRFAACILLFFFSTTFLNTRARWSAALSVLIGLMFVTSVYGILQYHNIEPLLNMELFQERRMIISTFLNKDFFASFLTYLVPVAVYWGAVQPSWPRRIAIWISGALGLAAIYYTASRGALLGICAFGVVAFVFEMTLGWASGGEQRAKRRAILAAAAAGGLLAIIALSPAHLTSRVGSIFDFGRLQQSKSNQVRIYMWWGTTRMVQEKPLFGHGIGTFNAIYPIYMLDSYRRNGLSHDTLHPHSEELEVLCEQGLVGLAGWLALGVAFLICGFRMIRARPDIRDRYLLFGLLAGFIAGVVHDSTNVNLRIMTSALVFWTVLGLGSRLMAGFDSPPDAKLPPVPAAWRVEPATRVVLYGALIAIFAAVFWGQYRVAHAQYLKRKGVDFIGRPATEAEGEQLLLKAIRENPYERYTYLMLGFHYTKKERLGDAVAIMDELTKFAPNYNLSHMYLYNTRKNMGQLLPAILEMEWASIKNNTLQFHIPLITDYQQIGRPQRAYDHARRVRREVAEDMSRTYRDVAHVMDRWVVAKGTAPKLPNELLPSYDFWPNRYFNAQRTWERFHQQLAPPLGLPGAWNRYELKQAVEREISMPDPPAGDLLARLRECSPDEHMTWLYLANILRRQWAKQYTSPKIDSGAYGNLVVAIASSAPPPGASPATIAAAAPLREFCMGLSLMAVNDRRGLDVLRNVSGPIRERYPKLWLE